MPRLRIRGFEPGLPEATRRRVVLVLVAAVLGISSSAVIIRGIEADALAVAAWRTVVASAVLFPAARGELRRLGRRDLAKSGVAGIFLGLHFWLWFASLDHTTVLRSTVMVSTVPVWTGLLEAALGRSPPARYWVGTAIALVGVGCLSAGSGGGGHLYGDALAAAAAWMWAGYFVLGKDVRARVGTVTWMCLACGAAALLLWPLALVGGVAVAGFSPLTWALLGASILGPQLIGHQGFAYAVRFLPAATLATVALLEPVGATLLAAVVLGEVPGPSALLGGGVLLAGVGWATAEVAPE
ncbi:MAG: drug/metabolite transporter (DMT)-like permease [Myxococcota bacterium]